MCLLTLASLSATPFRFLSYNIKKRTAHRTSSIAKAPKIAKPLMGFKP
ncbi:hypothetical protein GX50_09002 [[Emmonsia] crescens]|uniref:Uncharacterized protein n=1 Tax=[Emmonsia] crescens TaxID=73230 RepID=A0A2B7Y5N6_9EURO|nr:hypothetical protein GX50_09002 [Emmonsia crescens]